jgi:DNA-binding response OmpR family regulator
MDYKIAVVEDNTMIQQTIMINLEKQGYDVKTFSDGESLLKVLNKQIFDLIILDILLPGISGLELLDRLKDRGQFTPVLMLTVKRDLQSKIKALETGADDYLQKPFHMRELLLRVGAILRRVHDQNTLQAAQHIIVNGYKINLNTCTSESSKGWIKLSSKEIQLLDFFFRHPNSILRRDDILEEVWGMEVDPTPRTIDNFILKFRKLYEDDPRDPKHFITIRNQGYSFIP